MSTLHAQNLGAL